MIRSVYWQESASWQNIQGGRDTPRDTLWGEAR